MKALDRQIGGDHYKKYAIQPIEFIMNNGLTYIQGNIIKYVMRANDKGGLQDLKKAIHYAEIAVENDFYFEDCDDVEFFEFSNGNKLNREISNILFRVCCMSYKETIRELNKYIEKR